MVQDTREKLLFGPTFSVSLHLPVTFAQDEYGGGGDNGEDDC